MKNIIEAMQWRYATNKFEVSKKLSDEQLAGLLDATILAPSSFGLQPWKMIVVSNPEIRAKLQEAGYGQPKISEASHLIVFAVEKHIDDTLVDTFIKSVSEVRGIPLENLAGYAGMIKGAIAPKSEEERKEWAAKQAYLALGVLITAGAIEGIDVTAMEGFDPKKFDEILGLNEKGLETKVIAGVGFRASDDPSAEYKKVRYPKEHMVIEVK